MAMHLRTSALALLLAGARASSMSMTDDYSFVFANKSSSVGGGSSGELARPRYVTQPQDHFDDANSNEWQQAYYVNDTFWVPGSDAPVFLCVGGEGPPLSGASVVASPHCNVAVDWLKETKALMFAVEHRYYGCHNRSACPVKQFATKESLKFLSSRQALADLAGFHKQALAQYGLTKANKWVSFGGSYPGMLAGWFRLKYPSLVHASIASSAPVQAKVDMQGYQDVTAEAYSVSDNNVGGSPACMEAIGKGHAMIGKAFGSSSGRSMLAAIFGGSASRYAGRQNQADFAGNGVAQFPSQGNDPSCSYPACNIGKICAIMVDTSTGDEVHRLAKLRKTQESWARPLRERRLARHAQLRLAAAGQAPQLFDDYWGYQTCSEFAFYQTCEVGSRCFYTQGLVTLADYLPMCQTNYGISPAMVAANVNASNAYYGGDKPVGNCVYYVNGEVDPWHSLSVLSSPSAGIPVLMVGGASHHAWTHPASSTDQPSVVKARGTIRAQVSKWLASECDVSL